MNHSHKHGKPNRASVTNDDAASGKSEGLGYMRNVALLPERIAIMVKVQKFLRNCKAKGVNVNSRIRAVQRQGSGGVKKQDFNRVLSNMGLDLSRYDLNLLVNTNDAADPHTVPVHGLVGSLSRRLSPTEIAENRSQSAAQSIDVPMNKEEAEFAEHLSTVFNLIEAKDGIDKNGMVVAGAKRNNILRAMKTHGSEARAYAEMVPVLHPLLNADAYEASLYAYANKCVDDVIDVDEFVDFWFHHLPDHVKEHVETARGLNKSERDEIKPDVIGAPPKLKIEAKGNNLLNVDRKEAVSGVDTINEPTSRTTIDHNGRRRSSFAIPRNIRKPHHGKEFAIQVRLHSAANLRSSDWIASKSDPYVLLSLTGAGEQNPKNVWSEFSRFKSVCQDSRPITLDLSRSRSSTKNRTLSPVWSRQNTFVLVSSGLLTEKENESDTIIPPTLRMRVYDSEDFASDNFLGEIEHSLQHDNVLSAPSHSVDHAISLVLKDPNKLSPGLPPSITFSVGLCKAVIVHIVAFQCPSKSIASPESISAEIFCGEHGNSRNSKSFLCKTSTSATPKDQKNSDIRCFEWTGNLHAIGIEDFDRPELNVIVFVDGKEYGCCTVPLELADGIRHTEKCYPLTFGHDSTSTPKPLPHSTVSLSYRVLPRASFPVESEHQRNNLSQSATSEKRSRSRRSSSIAIAESKIHGHAGHASVKRRQDHAARKIQQYVRKYLKHRQFQRKLNLSLQLSSIWRGFTTRKDILYKAARSGSLNLVKTSIRNKRISYSPKHRYLGKEGKEEGKSPRSSLQSLKQIAYPDCTLVATARFDDQLGESQGLLHVAARSRSQSTKQTWLKHLRCCSWLASFHPRLLAVVDNTGITGKQAWHSLAATCVQRFARGYLTRNMQMVLASRGANLAKMRLLMTHGASASRKVYWKSLSNKNGPDGTYICSLMHLCVLSIDQRACHLAHRVFGDENDLEHNSNIKNQARIVDSESLSKKQSKFRKIHECLTYLAVAWPPLLKTKDSLGRIPLHLAAMIGSTMSSLGRKNRNLVWCSLSVENMKKPRSTHESKPCWATLDPHEPTWLKPVNIASIDLYTIAHHLVRLYPSTLTISDNTGMYALDFASVCGHTDLVQWLSMAAPEILCHCSFRDTSQLADSNNRTGLLHLTSLSEMSNWWPTAQFSPALSHNPSLAAIQVHGSKKDLRTQNLEISKNAIRHGMSTVLTLLMSAGEDSINMVDNNTHSESHIPNNVTPGTHKATSREFLRGNLKHPFAEWLRFERDNVFCFAGSAVSQKNWEEGLEPDVAYFEISLNGIERVSKNAIEDDQRKARQEIPFHIGFSDTCAWERYWAFVQNGSDEKKFNETKRNSLDGVGFNIHRDACIYNCPDVPETQKMENSDKNSAFQVSTMANERRWLAEHGFPEGLHPANIRKGYGFEFTLIFGEVDDKIRGNKTGSKAGSKIRVKKGDVVGCGWDRRRKWLFATVNGHRVRGIDASKWESDPSFYVTTSGPQPNEPCANPCLRFFPGCNVAIPKKLHAEKGSNINLFLSLNSGQAPYLAPGPWRSKLDLGFARLLRGPYPFHDGSGAIKSDLLFPDGAGSCAKSDEANQWLHAARDILSNMGIDEQISKLSRKSTGASITSDFVQKMTSLTSHTLFAAAARNDVDEMRRILGFSETLQKECVERLINSKNENFNLEPLTINMLDQTRCNLLTDQPESVIETILSSQTETKKAQWWARPSLRTVLHVASLNNAENVCEYLIGEAAPALIGKYDADGCAPAHLAARVDAIDALQAIACGVLSHSDTKDESLEVENLGPHLDGRERVQKSRIRFRGSLRVRRQAHARWKKVLQAPNSILSPTLRAMLEFPSLTGWTCLHYAAAGGSLRCGHWLTRQHPELVLVVPQKANLMSAPVMHIAARRASLIMDASHPRLDLEEFITASLTMKLNNATRGKNASSILERQHADHALIRLLAISHPRSMTMKGSPGKYLTPFDKKGVVNAEAMCQIIADAVTDNLNKIPEANFSQALAGIVPVALILTYDDSRSSGLINSELRSFVDVAYRIVAEAASKTQKILSQLYDEHLDQKWKEMFKEKKQTIHRAADYTNRSAINLESESTQLIEKALYQNRQSAKKNFNAIHRENIQNSKVAKSSREKILKSNLDESKIYFDSQREPRKSQRNRKPELKAKILPQNTNLSQSAINALAAAQKAEQIAVDAARVAEVAAAEALHAAKSILSRQKYSSSKLKKKKKKKKKAKIRKSRKIESTKDNRNSNIEAEIPQLSERDIKDQEANLMLNTSKKLGDSNESEISGWPSNLAENKINGKSEMRPNIFEVPHKVGGSDKISFKKKLRKKKPKPPIKKPRLNHSTSKRTKMSLSALRREDKARRDIQKKFAEQRQRACWRTEREMSAQLKEQKLKEIEEDEEQKAKARFARLALKSSWGNRPAIELAPAILQKSKKNRNPIPSIQTLLFKQKVIVDAALAMAFGSKGRVPLLYEDAHTICDEMKGGILGQRASSWTVAQRKIRSANRSVAEAATAVAQAVEEKSLDILYDASAPSNAVARSTNALREMATFISTSASRDKLIHVPTFSNKTANNESSTSNSAIKSKLRKVYRIIDAERSGAIFPGQIQNVITALKDRSPPEEKDDPGPFQVNLVSEDPSLLVKVGSAEESTKQTEFLASLTSDQLEALNWFTDHDEGASQNAKIYDLVSGNDDEIFATGKETISEIDFISFCIEALGVSININSANLSSHIAELNAALIPFIRAARVNVPKPRGKNTPLQINTSIANAVNSGESSLTSPNPQHKAKKRAAKPSKDQIIELPPSTLEKFRAEVIKALSAPIRKQHSRKIKFSVASARSIETALQKVERKNGVAKDKDGDGKISWMEYYGDATNSAVDLYSFLFSLEQLIGAEKPADEERREQKLSALFSLTLGKKNLECDQELRLLEDFSREYNRPEESGAFILRDMDMARFLCVPFDMLRRSLLPEFDRKCVMPNAKNMDKNAGAVSALPMLQRARILFHAAVLRCTLKIGFGRDIPVLTGKEVVKDILNSRQEKESELTKVLNTQTKKQRRGKQIKGRRKITTKLPNIEEESQNLDDEFQDAIAVDDNVLDTTLTSRPEEGNLKDNDETDPLFEELSLGFAQMGDQITPPICTSLDQTTKEEDQDDPFLQAHQEAGDQSLPPESSQSLAENLSKIESTEKQATPQERLRVALQQLDAVRIAEYSLSRAEHMLLLPEVVLPFANDRESGESRSRILRLRHAGLGSALDDAAKALHEAGSLPTRPIDVTWSKAFENADKKYASRDKLRMDRLENERVARAENFTSIGGGQTPEEDTAAIRSTGIWKHIPGEMWTLDVPPDPISKVNNKPPSSQKSHTLSGPLPPRRPESQASSVTVANLSVNAQKTSYEKQESLPERNAVEKAADSVDACSETLRKAIRSTRDAVAAVEAAEYKHKESTEAAGQAYRKKLAMRSRKSLESSTKLQEGTWEERKGANAIMNGGGKYYVNSATGEVSDRKPKEAYSNMVAEIEEAAANYADAVNASKIAKNNLFLSKAALREARREEMTARDSLKDAKTWLKEETLRAISSSLDTNVNGGRNETHREALPLPSPTATEAWATSKRKPQNSISVAADSRSVQEVSEGLDVRENAMVWEDDMRDAVKSIAQEDDAISLWAQRVRALAAKSVEH